MGLANTCGRPAAVVIVAAILMLTGAHPVAAQEAPARSASDLALARPAFDSPSESERRAVQDALIWTGQYNGVADGTFGRQTFDAITAYQQSRRGAASGILTRDERAELLASAQRARSAAGFTIVDDARTGVRIGIPTKVLPKSDGNPAGGTRWQSVDGKVTLDTRTAPPDATLQALYDRNLAIKAAGRNITYKILRPNFLVIAGETAAGKFYTRYDSGDAGIRGFSIGYDKALAPQIDRLVVAIANSFDPFGNNPPPAAMPQPVAAPVSESLPPSGRRVIATGIAIAPRRILTIAQSASCRDMKAGDIAVGMQQPQAGNARWSMIELPRDLPDTIPAILTGTAKADDRVLVLTYTTDDPRALAVVPGAMMDGRCE
jgi:hypothetical protein